MFASNPNSMNGGGGVNHNTYLRNLTAEATMLSLSLWNQNLSIRIRPSIGRDGNGVMQYDKNRQGQTAISVENAFALVEKFEKEMRPAYEEAIQNGTPCVESSISVETSGQGKNIITILMRPATDPSDTTPVMELVVDLSVDSEGIVQTGNEYRHEFLRKTVYKNYSAAVGYRDKEYVNADFMYFMSVLRCLGDGNINSIVAGHIGSYMDMKSKSFGSQQGPQAAPPQMNNYASSGVGFGMADGLPF